MSEAARSARGAFNDIGGGAEGMGRRVGGSMTEARHGLMMLTEEFGIHLPRGLMTAAASFAPLGAAMEAAFPFLAIILGATLLIQHLEALHAAGMKLTDDQAKFGIAAQNAFNALDEKILEAGIKADELNNDHLGALSKQLKLIDMQSMTELEHTFGELAKAADAVFSDIKSHWYTFGAGADGAKHSLETFQNEYDALLAQGKDKDATALLDAKVDRERQILDLQKQVKAQQANGGTGSDEAWAATAAGEAAKNKLKALGVGYTDNEVTAQQILVQALQDQVGVEERLATLKKLEASNVKKEDIKADTKDGAKAAREAAEDATRVRENELRDLEAAGREMVTAIDQTEREKIDATKEGSAARLAAIDSAIEHESDMMLRETAGYRSLLTERVELIRQMAEEAAKAQADAAREEAANAEKMGSLALAAEKEHLALMMSAHHVTAQQQIDAATLAANQELALQLTANAQEIAGLDKSGKDYTNKLKELQDKQKQLIQAHENEVTAIRDKAEIDRNNKILAEAARFNDTITAGLTQVLMGHESFAKMMDSLGNQVVSGMMQNAMKEIEANMVGKESDAAKAARKAYNLGISEGGPAGMVLGPVFAAIAFSTVSGFAEGGIVPGVGRGDIVPAMLEPGEGVLPKQLMERLSNSGSAPSSGHTYNLHVRPTYNVSTIDGDGMSAALEKHTDQLRRHFEATVRKMNR
jgi:hypothetical protein